MTAARMMRAGTGAGLRRANVDDRDLPYAPLRPSPLDDDRSMSAIAVFGSAPVVPVPRVSHQQFRAQLFGPLELLPSALNNSTVDVLDAWRRREQPGLFEERQCRAEVWGQLSYEWRDDVRLQCSLVLEQARARFGREVGWLSVPLACGAVALLAGDWEGSADELVAAASRLVHP